MILSVAIKPFAKTDGREPTPGYFVVCKALLILLLSNSAIAENSSSSRSKDLTPLVTTEDIIKRAQQYYGGKVISLANGSQSSTAKYYRLTLLNTKAEVIVVYVNKTSGEFVASDQWQPTP